MTHEEWIEHYRRAWETADADEIVDLFTPDASYRSSVFGEPYLGSDAIRRYWQRGAGSQRDVTVRMGRPVVAAGRVAVEWWTTMDDPEDGEITLPGCLLLRFAPDGRCHDLWEYWQVQPGKQDPPAGWGAEEPPGLRLQRSCRLERARVSPGPSRNKTHPDLPLGVRVPQCSMLPGGWDRSVFFTYASTISRADGESHSWCTSRSVAR